ncbi:MAG: hypothetical protein A2293_16315 [Elusimicrobia bacterium RIFOXYB2_FULL_49_7]|nr:MAG: hypothetical protein A2293_16315 [Elusimicrobia bacterium RIFOXYB2_FULL_49_7]
MRFPFFKTFLFSALGGLVLSIALLIAADISYLNAQSIRELFLSEEIRYSFFLTLATSCISTLFAMLFAIPSAYALSRFDFRGRAILDAIIDLPIVIPILVIGVSILVFFRIGSDLVDSPLPLLRVLGRFLAAMADFFIYQKPGIVLAQFYCAVSFAVRTIKANFDSIDPRTEKVALTLGCSRAQAFWRVSLPMARHGIMAGAVLAWARAFGVFGATSIVAGAVRKKTEVLPTSIFLEISIGRIETALAISMLMIVVALIMLLGLRLLTGGNIFGLGERS